MWVSVFLCSSAISKISWDHIFSATSDSVPKISHAVGTIKLSDRIPAAAPDLRLMVSKSRKQVKFSVH